MPTTEECFAGFLTSHLKEMQLVTCWKLSAPLKVISRIQITAGLFRECNAPSVAIRHESARLRWSEPIDAPSQTPSMRQKLWPIGNAAVFLGRDFDNH